MVFYYERFFRTALDGIDRSDIMPTTIQIGQLILLISFLVAVYESYIRGGDVRMLRIAGAKYVGLGLVLARALNMMTANLRSYTLGKLRDEDTVGKIRQDRITS